MKLKKAQNYKLGIFTAQFVFVSKDKTYIKHGDSIKHPREDKVIEMAEF